MKDLYSIWGHLAGRTYSAVNTNANNNRDSSDEYTETFGQKDVPRSTGPNKNLPEVSLLI